MKCENYQLSPYVPSDEYCLQTNGGLNQTLFWD